MLRRLRLELNGEHAEGAALFGGQAHRLNRLVFRMGLYWLTYKRYGRLAGVFIISADSLMAAQMRAAVAGLGGRIFERGHKLDVETAVRMPLYCIGRLLSRKEATALLEPIEREAGSVR